MLADNEEKLEAEVKGPISLRSVMLPVAISAVAITSQSSMLGAQKVAVAWEGVVSYLQGARQIEPM